MRMRRHAERRLTAEYVAARALLDATTFDQAAPKILEAICDTLGWEHGAVWAIDRPAHVLRCHHIWNTPGARFPEFDAVSRSTTFEPGVGLPGRVWANRRPAWIPDVVRDTNFPRAAAAAREGLHAAFGFPILLRGEVTGVLEFFSREIREPDEELLSMLATVGDQIGMFTDRRRAQEELDRFFALSLDMWCVAGFDGYFKRVNPAWQRTLGYTEAELLARPYMDLVHPDDRAATLAAAQQLSEGQTVVYFENRYWHRDGTLRWLLWASTPYPDQQVVYAAARDITERKAAEETLASYARDLETTHRELEEQAARLAQLVKELEISRRRAEEATEAKSAFVANMSHEIRTPLNAILGMTALALQTRLTPEQQDYLATVKASSESLLAIVNDILDFSRIEAHRLDLERARFDLRETVGDAAKLLALRASEKGIELACRIMPEVPETLVGDAGRLRQVLINVMGNAVKFTSEGEVVLHVRPEKTTDSRATLHFEVADTGIGVPAEKRDQIFQAFTQADSSTTRRYGGTGLGLAIAQRLVELMDGRIWVDSEVGRGSTFHFTASFDLPPGPDVRPATVMLAGLDGLRVLVVDDNATNRRILEEMLASWRMAPTAVQDAETALENLHAAPPDQPYQAIILDGQMPGIDGFSLARQIKRDPDLRATPIVMLTSVGRAEDVERCSRIGVNAHLAKPVKHSDLLDVLSTLFGVSTRKGPSPLAVPSTTPQRPLRVLVAEDNPVNRKLVTKLLEKRGHAVVAVETGREAVDAVARSGPPFDIVLMDLQMPEMSGFEATAAIRAGSDPSSGRVPIVALTAHAMQGDRERCLDAGMDGYLSKPIDVSELIATVERMAGGPAPIGSRPPEGRAAPIFDETAALAHTGGDRGLLEEIVALFRAEYPATLRQIGNAVKRRNGDALRSAAHSLKGSIATVGSAAGREILSELEQMGRSNRFGDAGPAVERLRDVIARLEKAFVAAGLSAASPRRARTARRRPGPSRKRRRP